MAAQLPSGRRKGGHNFLATATAALMNGSAIFFADIDYAILKLTGHQFNKLGGNGCLPHASSPGDLSLREMD